jgi:diacylglycerol kinase family enzyme
MKYRLIMNPGSRSGRGKRLWDTWEAALRRAGADFECCLTRSLDHARSLAKEPSGADAVVAVGGDGTINAVLDGILQSDRPDRPMGVLYSGTSPDFCRFHGIPLAPAPAVTALLHGQFKSVDAVRITCAGPGGVPFTAHFGCGSNIGLGAGIARQANRTRQFLGDRTGTGLATVTALFLTAACNLTARFDGVTHEFPRCNNLSILKSPFIASGLRLNVDLLADDGQLCAVAVSGQSPLGLLRILPGFYTGQAVGHPAVFLQKCRTIEVNGTAEVEFDGDPRGRLPLTADVLPRALNLLGAS